MPFCPNCKLEFEVSVKNCSDCGTELVTSLHEKIILDEDNFILLTVCTEMYEAEFIKANLESADINAFILSKQDRNYPFLGTIKIFVKKEDKNSARDYLKNVNKQSPSTDEE
jgi:hypothetical protein